jgi:hypothetical protein
MAQAHKLPKGTFKLDSIVYTWEVRHYAGAANPFQDAHGISVSINLDGVTRREMIIDFPFKDYGFAKPRSMGVFEERIKKCTRFAMTKGWDPESKGQPFRVFADWLESKDA